MQVDKINIWQIFAFQNYKGHWLIKLFFLHLKQQKQQNLNKGSYVNMSDLLPGTLNCKKYYT